MVNSLAGRVALVTGGAKRIGGAVALALAREGADLIVHYNRSAREAEEVVSAARRIGVRSAALAADLSGVAPASELFERAVATYGTIDLLINSASIFEESSFPTVSPEEIHRNVDVNALAPMELCRCFGAHVSGRERGETAPLGSIVNLLDTRMLDYDRRHLAYHLSKRMLFALTRIAASELAPSIRVNAVAPGLVLPPPGEGDDYLERLKGTNPLRAVGTLEQVCSAVLFLATNEFVTGQVIYVDGGRHLAGSFYGAE